MEARGGLNEKRAIRVMAVDEEKDHKTCINIKLCAYTIYFTRNLRTCIFIKTVLGVLVSEININCNKFG